MQHPITSNKHWITKMILFKNSITTVAGNYKSWTTIRLSAVATDHILLPVPRNIDVSILCHIVELRNYEPVVEQFLRNCIYQSLTAVNHLCGGHRAIFGQVFQFQFLLARVYYCILIHTIPRKQKAKCIFYNSQSP